MRNQRRLGFGFTLVEVLVSIGIVLVLAGIVVVLAGPAKMAAKRSGEVQNLRQHFLALSLYREENNPRIELGYPSDMGLPTYGLVHFQPAQFVLSGLGEGSFQTVCPHPEFFRWGTHGKVSMAYLAHEEEPRWYSDLRRFGFPEVLMYSQACNGDSELRNAIDFPRYPMGPPPIRTVILGLQGNVSITSSVPATYYP